VEVDLLRRIGAKNLEHLLGGEQTHLVVWVSPLHRFSILVKDGLAFFVHGWLDNIRFQRIGDRFQCVLNAGPHRLCQSLRMGRELTPQSGQITLPLLNDQPPNLRCRDRKFGGCPFTPFREFYP
jgi:hypothetical protein